MAAGRCGGYDWCHAKAALALVPGDELGFICLFYGDL
jgi:hypothetical protein